VHRPVTKLEPSNIGEFELFCITLCYNKTYFVSIDRLREHMIIVSLDGPDRNVVKLKPYVIMIEFILFELFVELSIDF
jgi:hypothetical protein